MTEYGFCYGLTMPIKLRRHVPVSHHEAATPQSHVPTFHRSQDIILSYYNVFLAYVYNAVLHHHDLHDLQAIASTPFPIWKRQGARAAAGRKLACSGKGFGVLLRWREARCDAEKVLHTSRDLCHDLHSKGHNTR
jgi:hypothetical protein